MKKAAGLQSKPWPNTNSINDNRHRHQVLFHDYYKSTSVDCKCCFVHYENSPANALHDANDTLSNCIDSSMNYWFANVSKWIKWHVVFLESCRYNDCLQHRWVNVNSQGNEDGFRLYAANMNGQETQLAHWICRIFQLASYFLLNNHKWLLSIVATRDRWWRVI